VRILDEFAQIRNEPFGLFEILLRSCGNPRVIHEVQLHDRLIRSSKSLAALVGHDPKAPAIPAVVREVDDRREASEVLVQKVLFLGSNEGEFQQALISRIEKLDDGV